MDSKLRVTPQFSRAAQTFRSTQSFQRSSESSAQVRSANTSQDAVQLSLSRNNGSNNAKLYGRLNARPPREVSVNPVQSDAGRRPAPIETRPGAKPVASDVSAPAKGLEGLFRAEADGSTTVSFGGLQLSIKSDGSVEGTIISPKGEPWAIKGTYKDGQVTADVENLGSYTANLSFSKADGIKGADGRVVLSDVAQINVVPTPTKPKPPEQINVDGVFAGDTAYFGGFDITFGKEGSVSVELHAPDGRKVRGTGTINDKGEITVRFDDPKTGFDGATYTAVFSRDGKDSGKARLSDVRFLGNLPASNAAKVPTDESIATAVSEA